MTIALCALCNLMGSATAVLVIPALQWIETEKVSTGKFWYMNHADPPSPSGFASTDTFDCWTAHFTSYNYTCASYDWADKLDAWTSSFVASAIEHSYQAITWQDELSFTVNTTTSRSDSTKKKKKALTHNDPTTWVPSRQLVKDFYQDAGVVSYISRGYSNTELKNASCHKDLVTINITNEQYNSYRLYNKSLELELQRNGPILGTYPDTNLWSWSSDQTPAWWTTVIDSSRALQCFSGYKYASVDSISYTKCIQDGAGWGSNTKYTNFTIEGAYDLKKQAFEPNVKYEVFSSDQVAFIVNGGTLSGVPGDCIAPGKVSANLECDWTALFAAPGPSPRIKNKMTTVKVSVTDTENITAVIAVDFVAYLAFTNYTLDPSVLTNPLRLVQTQTTPDHGAPVAINPAWTLAAWSVGEGGSVPARRTTATMLRRILLALNDLTTYYDFEFELNAVAQVTTFQSLSMIEYGTNASKARSPAKLDREFVHDPSHPVLTRNANIYVWAYGITTRTAYMGVVVTILGICVVLTQFVLGLVDRRRYRNPTQLLVAALEHAPDNEFNGKECEEAGMARVRFHVRDVHHTAGKFAFGRAGVGGTAK